MSQMQLHFPLPFTNPDSNCEQLGPFRQLSAKQLLQLSCSIRRCLPVYVFFSLCHTSGLMEKNENAGMVLS